TPRRGAAGCSWASRGGFRRCCSPSATSLTSSALLPGRFGRPTIESGERGGDGERKHDVDDADGDVALVVPTDGVVRDPAARRAGQRQCPTAPAQKRPQRRKRQPHDEVVTGELRRKNDEPDAERERHPVVVAGHRQRQKREKTEQPGEP